jgi:glycerol kinase
LLQFQSDLLRVRVIRPRTIETTALGAAYLAGLAVGFWKDQGEIGALWSDDRSFQPRAASAETTRLRNDWSRAVKRAKAWA